MFSVSKIQIAISNVHTYYLQHTYDWVTYLCLHVCAIGRQVTISAGNVIKQFNVELVYQLPLEDDLFFAMAKHADLFPLNTGDFIASEPTRAQKVSYFLQHVVEPGAEEYLPKLLKVMRDSKVANVVRLADDIQAAIDMGMCTHYW